jgi:hypothetical protein
VAAVHTPAIGGLSLSFSAGTEISLGCCRGSPKLGKHLTQNGYRRVICAQRT